MKEVLKMKLKECVKHILDDDCKDSMKSAPPKEDVWNEIQKRINSDTTTAPVSDSETE